MRQAVVKLEEVQMLRHQQFQQESLPFLRRKVGLPDGSLQEVLTALVEQEHYAHAAELMFGATRFDGLRTPIGFWLYMSLWTGRRADLFPSVIQNHFWEKDDTAELLLEVHPNEFLSINVPGVKSCFTPEQL